MKDYFSKTKKELQQNLAEAALQYLKIAIAIINKKIISDIQPAIIET